MASTTALADGQFRITRVQRNVVARRERQILDELCQRVPAAVLPDHMTLVGLVGAVVTFAGYLANRFSPDFLWLASLGLVIHWLGDSLDGSLARHRRVERPAYGYFLDHSVDAFSNLVIMLGIGFSLHVRMDVALFALLGYYLLCIYVFINNHINGVLELSFLGFGPTELRLGLIAINTGIFFAGDPAVQVGGEVVTVYDGVLLVAGTTFVLIFVMRTLAGIQALEQDHARATQMAARNPSRLAK